MYETLITASVGSTISGIGRSSIAILRGPLKTTAFMVLVIISEDPDDLGCFRGGLIERSDVLLWAGRLVSQATGNCGVNYSGSRDAVPPIPILEPKNRPPPPQATTEVAFPEACGRDRSGRKKRYGLNHDLP